MSTPNYEPSQFMAGDTVSWLKTLDDYPVSDGWTLNYVLRSATQHYHITCTTSGTNYLATITAVISAAYAAGTYTWTSYVTKGAGETLEQHSVAQGSVVITPNLTTNALVDARTDARIIYDSLIAAFKTFASSGGRVTQYSIGGRSTTYEKSADIIKDIEHWRIIVQREEDAAKIAAGHGNPRRVGVRFNRI